MAVILQMIFEFIFFTEMRSILIQILPKFIANGQINKKNTLV